MTKLTNSEQPSQPKTNPVTATHWLGDLLKLFPPTTELTPERLRAMAEVFTSYPESLLKEICHPTSGMAISFKFLPSLFEFRRYCEERAGEAAERERWAKEAAAPRRILPPQDPTAGCYTGPIEYVKPGDILHYTRFEEYREFMRTKKNIPSVRLWGANEVWIDNNQRPFQIDIKQEEKKQEEPNPFA